MLPGLLKNGRGLSRLQTVGFFHKISREIGKALRNI